MPVPLGLAASGVLFGEILHLENETQTAPALRPLGFTDILDEGIYLYRRNFLLFFGIAAVLLTPLEMINQVGNGLMSRLASGDTGNIPQAGATVLFGVFGILFYVLLYLPATWISTAAMTKAMADRYLQRPASLAESYRAIKPIFWRLVGTLLLSYLAYFALLLPFIITLSVFFTGLFMSIGGNSGMMMVGGIGLAVGFIYLFWVGIFVILPWSVYITPTVVVEKRAGVDALKRSWSLMKPRRMPAVGILVIVSIIMIVITTPFQIITQAIVTVSVFLLGPAALLSGLATALATPFVQVVSVLLYFDSRVRLEGFDLELLSCAFTPAEEPGQMN